jgi:hypothetical protein
VITQVKAIEEAVKLVGHVRVIERDGMGVVPQGGGGIPVAEAGLGLKQLPLVSGPPGPRQGRCQRFRGARYRPLGRVGSGTDVARRSEVG